MTTKHPIIPETRVAKNPAGYWEAGILCPATGRWFMVKLEATNRKDAEVEGVAARAELLVRSAALLEAKAHEDVSFAESMRIEAARMSQPFRVHRDTLLELLFQQVMCELAQDMFAFEMPAILARCSSGLASELGLSTRPIDGFEAAAKAVLCAEAWNALVKATRAYFRGAAGMPPSAAAAP